jgi:predicted dehydrogenase
LEYVCDIKVHKAQELAKKYNCKSVTDYKELLKKDLDVVNICTPNNTHSNIALDFFSAKKHVVCEKPMSLSNDDGKRMIDAAEKNKVHLFIVKQNRYNPPVKAARSILESGKLGKPYMCVVNVYWNRRSDYYSSSDWKGKIKEDGGALFTQCSHFIDLMLMLFGQVESVIAKTGNFTHPTIEIEDTGVIIVRFKNGSLGSINYTTSVYSSNFEGSITLFGSDGTIKIGGEYLNKIEHWDVKDTPLPQIEKGAPPNDYGTYKGSMSNHDQVIQNVIDVIKNNGKIHTTGEEGLETTKVINAIYASAADGSEVKV